MLTVVYQTSLYWDTEGFMHVHKSSETCGQPSADRHPWRFGHVSPMRPGLPVLSAASADAWACDAELPCRWQWRICPRWAEEESFEVQETEIQTDCTNSPRQSFNRLQIWVPQDFVGRVSWHFPSDTFGSTVGSAWLYRTSQNTTLLSEAVPLQHAQQILGDSTTSPAPSQLSQQFCRLYNYIFRMTCAIFFRRLRLHTPEPAQ